MDVIAKFKVVTNKPTADGSEIVAYPVTSGSKENDSFFKYTPAGGLTLSIVQEQTALQFVEGAEFYVHMTDQLQGREI